MCNKKGVKEGYPLKIEAKKVDIVKTEFNEEFIKGILTKINYDALKNAVQETKRKWMKKIYRIRKKLTFLYHNRKYQASGQIYG